MSHHSRSIRGRKASEGLQGRAKKQREVYQQRISRGECSKCGVPAVAGKTLCQKHYDSKRKRRVSQKANGKCGDCGKPALRNRARCGPCHTRTIVRLKKVADDRLRSGLCVRCGLLPHDPGNTACKSCREKLTAHMRSKRLAWREAGICEICGKAPRLSHAKYCYVCFFKSAVFWLLRHSDGSRKITSHVRED